MDRTHGILLAALLVTAVGLATSLLTPRRGPVNLYVALTGSDTTDCRTITTPCATIAYALEDERCNPGDTIHVRAGTYHTDPSTVGEGNGDVFSYLHDFCHGSASAWVTITAYAPAPGVFEPVTIRSINYDPTVAYHVWQRIAVDVSGRARTGGYDCIRLAAETHHIRLLDMECRNALSTGPIGVGDRAHHIEILGTCSPLGVCTCASHHNGDDVELDHGMYLSGDDITVDGCAVHDNAAFGVQFWAEGGPVSERGVLKNSFIHGNGLTSPNGGGIALGGANDLLVLNNIVYNNHDGIVTLNGTNFRVVNNTFYANTRYGVEIQNGPDQHQSINNIIWGNGEVDQVYRVAVEASANLCRGQGSAENPTCAVQTNPQFVNPPTDVRLRPGSPAIGAGVDLSGIAEGRDALGTPRPWPARGASDLGALEFTPARPPEPPEPPPTDLVRLLCESLTHPDLSAGTWLLCHQQEATR